MEFEKLLLVYHLRGKAWEIPRNSKTVKIQAGFKSELEKQSGFLLFEGWQTCSVLNYDHRSINMLVQIVAFIIFCTCLGAGYILKCCMVIYATR